MSYFLAPSLVRLRADADREFPGRDRASDGWIGDPSHAARKSDHNPDWGAPGRRNGIVRAVDIDISPDGRPDADLRRELLNATLGDARVWYVISNGIIYSRTYGFRALNYTGINGHFAHVHVSLLHAEQAEFSTASWFDLDRPRLKSAPVSLGRTQKAFVAAATGKGDVAYLPGVQRIQQALNNEYDLELVLDGLAGVATLNAWGRHEEKVGGYGRPRVPDGRTLRALAKGRWQVVA